MQQNKIVVLSASLAALFLMGASTVQAQNARPGGEKTASCEQCHGVGGAAPVQGLIPKLCGQNAEYLEAALVHFQDGRRPQPVMHATTTQLPKDVLKQLAVYFSNSSCTKK